MSPALQVRDLVKRYGSLAAVDGVSLQADAGQVLAVLGPNGAGKTTTIEICAGMRRADAGSVLLLDRAPGDPALRAQVGVMPQSAGCYPGARAGEMLALVASYYADPLDPAALLERLGLSTVARTSWRRLSGGQQQRLSLAMALVGRPRLVFLDEPSAGLDVQARRETWELISQLRADGVAVVLTTHAMEEAEGLADQVVIVDHGRVIATGSPAQLTGTGTGGSVRFRAREGLDLATLGHSLPASCTAREDPPGRYLVEGGVTAQVLATVTAWCAAADELPQDLRVAARSLEDVFLELTGRDLRA